ncbi:MULTISPECIES: diacylglycerol kinase family protein [unclassified Microbacterium]|uniref:diacylglycerol/lipid kinase family protein n=1 Tax=unclassified Microbacterium TaxID=2609290 RepID=UPI000C2C8D52|nr:MULTISPECIES: diacylglycerol kinase family protein [unclassified Microbacterium]
MTAASSPPPDDAAATSDQEPVNPAVPRDAESLDDVDGLPKGFDDESEPVDGPEDNPDPAEAAKPDDVIREPEDIAPDKADGETGEARQVTPEGETTSMDADDPSPKKRAALVYNPIKVDKNRLRSQVTRLSAEADWAEPLFFETTVDDLGDDVTRQALAEGVDAVMVAGGDGTVRAVSEAMSGTGVPLTIVPSGTGNLLARNLGLPLGDSEPMVAATFAGTTQPVDIGFADIRRTDGSRERHAFVVMAGIGLDAAMIANTNSQLKKTVGWVAYVDGAARSLATAKPFRVMYQMESGRLHAAKVQSVLFANCGALPAGIALIPEASVVDGLLDVAVIQPSGWLGWLGVWRKVWWDNSVLRRFRAGRRVLERRGRNSSVRFLQGEGIELATSPAQPIELDGDELGEAVRIRCTIEQGGLSVVVPRGHDTSNF